MYGINYIADVGILSGHVALANNMNQMIPIAFMLMLSSKNKYAFIAAACCLVVFLIALVGSGSRGGIVGIFVTGGVIVYFSQKRLKTGIVVALVAIILFISVGSSIVSTAGRINSGSTEGRLVGLTHGMGMLLQGNIIGVGPGCFLFGRERYFSYKMEAHNLYGQIIGDLGIPGMISWFFFMRQIFLNINKLKGRLQNSNHKSIFLYNVMLGIQISLITRLVISLASHGLYYFYWYVLAAIIVSCRRILDIDPILKK